MTSAKPNPVDSAPQQELRTEGRTSTVFRPVLIETEGFAGFCLVRNISPTGLMGEVYTAFVPGTRALLRFEPTTTIHGQVRWCTDGRVGIEFDEVIDVAKVLSAGAAEIFDGKVNRAPRLKVNVSGEVIFERRAIPIEIQNISQKGLRVRASFLQPGEEVEVRLEGMKGRKAIVRWTKYGVAGLNFISPIPFVELAHWIILTNIPAERE